MWSNWIDWTLGNWVPAWVFLKPCTQYTNTCSLDILCGYLVTCRHMGVKCKLWNMVAQKMDHARIFCFQQEKRSQQWNRDNSARQRNQTSKCLGNILLLIGSQHPYKTQIEEILDSNLILTSWIPTNNIELLAWSEMQQVLCFIFLPCKKKKKNPSWVDIKFFIFIIISPQLWSLPTPMVHWWSTTYSFVYRHQRTKWEPFLCN